MPRFTLKELFWCVTLIALGVAIIVYFATAPWTEPKTPLYVVFFSQIAFPLMGAGIGVLYQQKAAGAAIGFVVLILAGIAIYILLGLMGWRFDIPYPAP